MSNNPSGATAVMSGPQLSSKIGIRPECKTLIPARADGCGSYLNFKALRITTNLARLKIRKFTIACCKNKVRVSTAMGL